RTPRGSSCPGSVPPDRAHGKGTITASCFPRYFASNVPSPPVIHHAVGVACIGPDCSQGEQRSIKGTTQSARIRHILKGPCNDVMAAAFHTPLMTFILCLVTVPICSGNHAAQGQATPSQVSQDQIEDVRQAVDQIMRRALNRGVQTLPGGITAT